MDTIVSESVARRSFQAGLLVLFGAIAVTLSGMGVFGVMSYAVAQRSKELGIRLALGASPGLLRRMVLSYVVRLVGTGMAVGLPLAVAVGYALRDALFGVGPADAGALALASAVILLVALAAGWIPARRATLVDPVTTLRAE